MSSVLGPLTSVCQVIRMLHHTIIIYISISNICLTSYIWLILIFSSLDITMRYKVEIQWPDETKNYYRAPKGTFAKIKIYRLSGLYGLNNPEMS